MTRRPLFPRALACALALTTAGVSSSSEAARSRQEQPSWQRTDSQRYEIHYQPALAGELDRVVRTAERAYDRVSGRLDFVLGARVPLIVFAPAGAMRREDVVAYGISERVAPHQPHRSRLIIPLDQDDARLEALIVHELTHVLVNEIVQPGRGGDGGVPHWVQEGIASYMVGTWPDDRERLMRELVGAGEIPALSRLTGSGGFANTRLNDALGHAAFDYIASRWGAGGVRRFVDALIVPRVDKTYAAVFDLTPEQFDAAFRQYAARRFGPAAR